VVTAVGGGSPKALVARARRHEFEGDPGSTADMTSKVESYPGNRAAWRQREGVGATELNSGEARGGRWRLGLGSGSTVQGGV
jgi:hypothetical protein